MSHKNNVNDHQYVQSRLYHDTVSQIGREIHQNGSRSPQVQMSGFISYMRNLQLKGYLLWSVGLCKFKKWRKLGSVGRI